MIFFNVLSLFVLAIGVQSLSIASRGAPDKAAYPLTSLGNIAAIQLNSAGSVTTRLFYQDESGDIIIHETENGPFTKGNSLVHRTLVPADQVLRSTPIAATILGDAAGIHVYFLSPNRKLNEFRYTSGVGWRGGVDCPHCIDQYGFTVAEDKVFYALEHQTSNVLRVGFISTDYPGTVSEAVSITSGLTWKLAPLPGAETP